ncbi:hypothetical protein Tco_0686682 [Tanacetum coccineum]
MINKLVHLWYHIEDLEVIVAWVNGKFISTKLIFVDILNLEDLEDVEVIVALHHTAIKFQVTKERTFAHPVGSLKTVVVCGSTESGLARRERTEADIELELQASQQFSAAKPSQTTLNRTQKGHH